MADLDRAHLPEELELLIAVTLGDKIERALTDKTSPFARMMDNARAEYIAAVAQLIEVELHNTVGRAEASRLQAQARRYRDLCEWIGAALEQAGHAEDALDQDHDEDAVEQLKEQLNGPRTDKPAFDA